MSASFKAGGSGSDSANVIVTILGMVLILGGLWLGDFLTAGQREPDSASSRAVQPAAAVAEAN